MFLRSWPLAVPVVFSLLAACGASDDFVSPNDLAPPAPVGRVDAGSSSSGQAPPSGSSSGGTTDAGSSSGEVPPVPSCSLTASYNPIEAVPGLPPAAREASFTGNELVAFFVQLGPPVQRVYAATRASRTEAFGPAVLLGSAVNSGGSILHVSVKDDGLELYFTRDDGGRQLYVAKRDAVGEEFRPAELLRSNATNELYVRDGSARFFSRSVDGAWQLHALRPATADEASAQPTGPLASEDGWLTSSVYPAWFEAPSNTLWFYAQEYYVYGPDDFAQREGIRTSQWDPATGTWSYSAIAEHRVVWISPDWCRLYSVTENGIAMRERVRTP